MRKFSIRIKKKSSKIDQVYIPLKLNCLFCELSPSAMPAELQLLLTEAALLILAFATSKLIARASSESTLA